MHTETVTVMIVDLVGSTPLIAAVPRTRMDQLMADAAGPIRRLVEGGGGRVVKFTGDGYLSVFHSASDALQVANEVVRFFASQPVLPIGERLPGCRVALNTCDVTPFEDDVLGEGVVVAARMEKQIPDNSVYLTASVRDVAKHGEFEFEFVGDLVMKGVPDPVSTYRLLTGTYKGIERDVVLTVTDLVGLSRRLARQGDEPFNSILGLWVGMHRDAFGMTGSRLRSVVGDNVVLTHPSADQAVEFILNLCRLSRERNRTVDVADQLVFSSYTARGDLFVSDFGILGPLVAGAFRALSNLDGEDKLLHASVYTTLTGFHGQFKPRRGAADSSTVSEYELIGA